MRLYLRRTLVRLDTLLSFYRSVDRPPEMSRKEENLTAEAERRKVIPGRVSISLRLRASPVYYSRILSCTAESLPAV